MIYTIGVRGFFYVARLARVLHGADGAWVDTIETGAGSFLGCIAWLGKVVYNNVHDTSAYNESICAIVPMH